MHTGDASCPTFENRALETGAGTERRRSQESSSLDQNVSRVFDLVDRHDAEDIARLLITHKRKPHCCARSSIGPMLMVVRARMIHQRRELSQPKTKLTDMSARNKFFHQDKFVELYLKCDLPGSAS